MAIFKKPKLTGPELNIHVKNICSVIKGGLNLLEVTAKRCMLDKSMKSQKKKKSQTYHK